MPTTDIYMYSESLPSYSQVYWFHLVFMQMAQTPLHVSAGYDRAEIIKFLLDRQGPEKAELEAKNMVCKNFICFH